MAEVFVPRHHPHESMDIITGQNQSSERATPLTAHTANPAEPDSITPSPFVFPGFQDPATMQDAHRRQLEDSEVKSGSRRPVSRSRPKTLSINALPAFEFGAGSTGIESNARGLSPSPTHSPVRRTPPFHHTSGHRRGNSEFVGGDVNNPITAGVGPIAGEELPPTLLVKKPSVPPSGRRGHAHRRSGALSQHDLSMILKPSNENRAGSAPTTPCDLSAEFSPSSYFETDRSLSQPASTTFFKDRSPSPSRQTPDGPPRAAARVTFNNDPEYIPRPLSTISSDTSSSMSTVRANHSLTDSITSIVSGNTSSPAASLRTARIGSSSTDNGTNPSNGHRKRSSGSIPSTLQTEQGYLWSSPNFEPHSRPSSAPMEETPAARRIDFQHSDSYEDLERSPQTELGADEFTQGSKHTKDALPNSDSTISPQVLESSRKQRNHASDLSVARPRTSPEPKLVKRQKKVKSWAGSILSRKNRHHLEDVQIHHQGRRISTPPPPPPPLTDPSANDPTPPLPPGNAEFSFDNVTFDEDTTTIISRPHSPPGNTSRNPATYQNFDEHNISPAADDESPMLDLDAALAPADRPTSSSDGNSTYSNTKRRMHSSGETGGFTGPGGHYHRRAESAPELDYFDYSRLGFAHRGSNPAMTEAIEEEEEEDEEEKEAGSEEDEKKEQEQGEELRDLELGASKDKFGDESYLPEHETGLGVNIVDSENSRNEPIRRRKRRADDFRNDSISPKSHAPAPRHIWGGVEIVGADEEPRSSVITKSSDESTITPTLSPEPQQPITTPLDVATATSMLTAVGETPSALSSPSHGKTSFDNHDPPRIHTATSSITDRVTLNSSRTGDFGHGSSVDDVPSLTSSASTMISGHPTRFSSSANTTSSLADRSSSLSAAVPARTSVRPGSSKRSSLASLSRLVGGPYNRSKLNIAELAPPDSPEKVEKRRSKRLSRLMFWKSKEKLSSS